MGAGLCERRSERSSGREGSGGCAHQGGRSAKRSDRKNRCPGNVFARRRGSRRGGASRATNGGCLSSGKTRDSAPRSNIEKRTAQRAVRLLTADRDDYFLLLTAIFNC